MQLKEGNTVGFSKQRESTHQDENSRITFNPSLNHKPKIRSQRFHQYFSGISPQASPQVSPRISPKKNPQHPPPLFQRPQNQSNFNAQRQPYLPPPQSQSPPETYCHPSTYQYPLINHKTTIFLPQYLPVNSELSGNRHFQRQNDMLLRISQERDAYSRQAEKLRRENEALRKENAKYAKYNSNLRETVTSRRRKSQLYSEQRQFYQEKGIYDSEEGINRSHIHFNSQEMRPEGEVEGQQSHQCSYPLPELQLYVRCCHACYSMLLKENQKPIASTMKKPFIPKQVSKQKLSNLKQTLQSTAASTGFGLHQTGRQVIPVYDCNDLQETQ